MSSADFDETLIRARLLLLPLLGWFAQRFDSRASHLPPRLSL
jgi:hypothetical protein